MHKQKLQGQQAPAAQQASQVQPAQATQANPQLAAVTTTRPAPGPVANLQVTRLVRFWNGSFDFT